MAAYIVVALAALGSAGLTLYSGFGLGTILMPVFALFFPVETAVAATAAVHGANNLFKVAMVGRHADRNLVLRFGLPAIVAALGGAAVLGLVSGIDPIGSYRIGPRTAVVTPVKLVMGLLMIVFASFELLPRLKKIQFDHRYLFVGGILSGFFGGLSGHQGALRAAFLVKTGITTEIFVGTSATIGLMIDLARIATYAVMFFVLGKETGFGPGVWPLVLTGILAAFVGVRTGLKFLHKVTMGAVRTLTGVFLLLIALALGSGIL